MQHRFYVLFVSLAFVHSTLAVPRLGAEIGFTLSATTDGSQTLPAFHCTGDRVYKFPFEASRLPDVGQMAAGSCTLQGPFPVHRAMYLLSLASDDSEQESVFYNINIWTGAIDGKSLLEQNTRFFDGQAMSYGVSHAAPPITDQAYIYTGSSRERWMEALQTDLPDLLVTELVLPGAHNAGMYALNVRDVAEAIGRLCQHGSLLEAICAVGGSLGAQAIANLSLNQKDTAYDQLRLGTRFFDLRPGYSSDGVAYHIHNFVPGVAFDSFLGDVNRFLLEATKEIVFLQVTDTEIDRVAFTPLSKGQVQQALARTIDEKVGFTIVDSIAEFNGRKLTALADSGTRVIAVFGKSSVNDSYRDEAYSQSLTDPTSVIEALQSALGRCAASGYQYNNFQLQDTGQLALEHYEGAIAANLLSWANALLFSTTGSLLQATKPFFDRGTYAWLVDEQTLAEITKCRAPVMLLNDFVDPALAARGEALSRYRHSQLRACQAGPAD